MIPRLLDKYKKEIIPSMVSKFNYKNSLQTPRIKKVVINMGVGEAITDIKILDKAMEELGAITGQKPMMRRSKIAISNFKIKKNQPIGCKVTLRRTMMYEFLDRLFNLALPRIRDFRGLAADSFDDQGNYSFGITEQTIFPEIEFDRIQRVQGMDITIALSPCSKDEARELLRLFGVPFKTEKS